MISKLVSLEHATYFVTSLGWGMFPLVALPMQSDARRRDRRQSSSEVEDMFLTLIDRLLDRFGGDDARLLH